MKEYTELQTAFLEALFSPECEGDVTKAKKVAGYSDGTATKDVVDSLADEIADLTRKYMARSAAKAAFTMGKVLDDDDLMLGVKDKITASKDILDRAGFVKTDKVEVVGVNPMFILPAKKEEEDQEA